MYIFMERLREDYVDGEQFYDDDLNLICHNVNELDDIKQEKLISGNGIEIDSSNTISCTLEYIPGDGVTIDSGNTISTNTDATTTEEISLSNGAPINALGIWPNDKIPQGTSVQEILEKLLLREIFPSVATKPSISLSGGTNIGVVEMGSQVTIPAITMRYNSGKFDKDMHVDANTGITPSVSWSTQTITPTVTKFSGVTIASGTTGTTSVQATVELGSNSVSYSASASYTRPSNLPVTNLGHETQSTTQVVTSGSDITAIWEASSTTTSATVTATGVYPCFTNISGNTLVTSATSKCALTSGTTITLDNVPSEVEANKHFVFEYPSGRTCTFQIKDLSGNFVNYSSTYSETGTPEHVGYIRLETTGDNLQGVNTYRFILSKSLNS